MGEGTDETVNSRFRWASRTTTCNWELCLRGSGDIFMVLFKPRSPVITELSFSEARVDSGFRKRTGREWWHEAEGCETQL